MLTGKRAELAAALSTVPGLRGHPYRPGTVQPGDAWSLLSSLERDEGLAFLVTWRVLVVLPGDERAASDRIDELVPLLVDALEPAAFVDTIEPVKIETGAGDMYALQVNVRSE